MVFQLLQLGLPLSSWNDEPGGLGYDPLSHTEEIVVTGHEDGSSRSTWQSPTTRIYPFVLSPAVVEKRLGTHHKHPSDNRAQRLRYHPCALGVDSPVAQQPAAW